MNDRALMEFDGEIIVCDPSDELGSEGSVVLKLVVNTQGDHLGVVELS
jgi:hypothetical protein